MTILVENEAKRVLDFDYEEVIKNVVKRVVDTENCPYEVEVNVLLTNNEEIHEANKDFRNIDRPTDVLSFPMYEKNDFEEKLEEIYVENNIPAILGDIVIDILQVERQAEEYNTGIIRELSYMTVHSFYHLMGEDHMEEEDKKVMRQKEENVLKELGELCK